jgi:alpha/beta superfamily hydrolase
MIINGQDDQICPLEPVNKLVDKLNSQRGISIDYRVIPNCNHSFIDHLDTIKQCVTDYIQKKYEKDVVNF